jgi:hypothetical protein
MRSVGERLAGLEACDTADLEVCVTVRVGARPFRKHFRLTRAGAVGNFSLVNWNLDLLLSSALLLGCAAAGF